MCVFVKKKTAYELRISDWSSDVCSSDLCGGTSHLFRAREPASSVRRDLRQEWRQSDGPYPGCECKEAPRRHQSGGCTGYWACGGTEGHRIYRSRLQIGRASCRERVGVYV